jgi:phospholipase A1
MKNIQIKFSIFLLVFSFFSVNAQIQALFNSKTQLRNMTERWELDTTSRGTFGHHKPMYVAADDGQPT